jgi:hypothetical protein
VPGCHSLLQARRAPAPQAGCRGCLRTPACLACASLSPAQGSTPCASRNSGQSAEVQRGATRYQPPFKQQPHHQGKAQRFRGCRSGTTAARSSTTAECRGSEGGTNDTTASSTSSSSTQGRAQRFKCCRRHHSLLRGSTSRQQGTQVQRVPTDAPPPSPCLAQRTRQHGPQWAELERSTDTLPVTMPVVKAKARPHSNGNLHTSPQQTACSSYHARPKPRASLVLAAPRHLRRQLQRLPGPSRLQQHGLTRRVGQLNANYGQQHKAQWRL